MGATVVETFEAKTERIVDPDVLDALILMPFGVALSRRVHIDDAPICPPTLRKEAMHCLVILCGGKDILVQTNAEQRDHLISARVGVHAKSPPLDCLMNVGGKALLDVGKFLVFLQTRHYAVHEVRAVLNGPQKHTTDAADAE